jgi:ribosomal protein S18 acetylase RimI-like enzyme
LEIVRCPFELRREALAVVLCELAPSQRRAAAKDLLEVEDASALAREPLFIARRDGRLCGAAWGQRQSGNIAIFWPPQLVSGEVAQTSLPLAEVVMRELDETAVSLAQSLLVDPEPAMIDVLQQVGFQHVADLLYLTCESERFPVAAPEPCEVGFEEYRETQRGRLREVIERTYKDTLDCTALNGARDLDDVVNGYQATGEFRAENWLFVRSGGRDVGVLLLADHRPSKQWELMYMGLVPEARGRGWGRQIARYAQWLARGARVERVLVAVDAANKPAADAYRSSGFELWERRVVYVRIRAEQHQ